MQDLKIPIVDNIMSVS